MTQHSPSDHKSVPSSVPGMSSASDSQHPNPPLPPPNASMSRLSHVPLVESNTTLCNRTVASTHLVGDSASSAEFFVGMAIVCFLYAMLALLVYLGYMHVYKN